MNDIEKRIAAAIERITSGHASMRVPAEDTDPDLVLADCRAEIRLLRSSLMQQWQSIETAPRDGAEVLICGGTYSYGMWADEKFDRVSIARWYGDHWRGEDRQSHDDWYSHSPAYWMPLPAALEAVP